MKTAKVDTYQVAVTVDEIRALMPAIEMAAYIATGSGRQDKAALLWGVFKRLEHAHADEAMLSAVSELADGLRAMAAQKGK